MKTVLLLIVSISAYSQDKYILPKDIVEARNQVLDSKRKLDRDILMSYHKLCHQKKVSEAEHIEMLAYQEITKETCWTLIFRKSI